MVVGRGGGGRGFEFPIYAQKYTLLIVISTNTIFRRNLKAGISMESWG